MTKFPVGAHVVYKGNSYSFPGEVTMRDGTSVVVKAFGDSEGNYTSMKHIYADHVLQEYTFGDTKLGIPPLVLFPDEIPFAKMMHYVAKYSEQSPVAIKALDKLLKEMAELANIRAHGDVVHVVAGDWPEREAEALASANIPKINADLLKLLDSLRIWVDQQSAANTHSLYNRALTYFGIAPVIPD